MADQKNSHFDMLDSALLKQMLWVYAVACLLLAGGAMVKFAAALDIASSKISIVTATPILTKRPLAILAAGLICGTCPPAFALAAEGPMAAPQDSDENNSFPVPAALETMIKCQSVTDDDARLQCYDRAIVKFNEATDKGDIIVAEKTTVDNARKEVFGLSLSENPIFGDKEDEGVRSIESTIRSAKLQRDGKWIIILETGAWWRQTSARRPRSDPKPGQTVIIERGLLGSFNVKINDKHVFKALRAR